MALWSWASMWIKGSSSKTQAGTRESFQKMPSRAVYLKRVCASDSQTRSDPSGQPHRGEVYVPAGGGLWSPRGCRYTSGKWSPVHRRETSLRGSLHGTCIRTGRNDQRAAPRSLVANFSMVIAPAYSEPEDEYVRLVTDEFNWWNWKDYTRKVKSAILLNWSKWMDYTGKSEIGNIAELIEVNRLYYKKWNRQCGWTDRIEWIIL